jgi:hypothetical protein
MPSRAGCTGICVSLSDPSSTHSVSGVELLESTNGRVDGAVEGAVEGDFGRRVEGVDEDILDFICLVWFHCSAVWSINSYTWVAQPLASVSRV